MRNLMFRFGAAVLITGVLAFTATPTSAGGSKKCWAHQDTDMFLADGVTPNPDYQQFVRVWATGGGHDKHPTDELKGETTSYEACVAL